MVDLAGGSGFSQGMGNGFAMLSGWVGFRVSIVCDPLQSEPSPGVFVAVNVGALCGGTGGAALNDVAAEAGRPRGPLDCTLVASIWCPVLAFLFVSSDLKLF